MKGELQVFTSADAGWQLLMNVNYVIQPSACMKFSIIEKSATEKGPVFLALSSYSICLHRGLSWVLNESGGSTERRGGEERARNRIEMRRDFLEGKGRCLFVEEGIRCEREGICK